MKKFIVLFLIFSLLILSGNLIAKEKRGAELIVQKKDGQRVRGELITVKKNSLLLLDAETGADVSVDISDIKVVKIVHKGNFGTGVGLGLLIGGGGGALVGLISGDDPPGLMSLSAGEKAAMLGIGFGVIGLFIGGIAGAAAGADEKIQIEGNTPHLRELALEKLRKKARIPDYE